MTPHISCDKLDIASIVIMPGDPKRVEYIVKKYLTDYKLVNDVRKETAYTGYYKGKRVTVFSSGMGIPSMGIYSYELFKYYGVDVIIRIGSAGAYTTDLKLNDIQLVSESYSTSNYMFELNNIDNNIVSSDKSLNDVILSTSKELEMDIKVGRTHSTEAFYNNLDIREIYDKYNCMSVEMESYSLLANAMHLGKKASCLLTISDSLITKEQLSSIERETTFDKMIILSLESSLKL